MSARSGELHRTNFTIHQAQRQTVNSFTDGVFKRLKLSAEIIFWKSWEAYGSKIISCDGFVLLTWGTELWSAALCVVFTLCRSDLQVWKYIYYDSLCPHTFILSDKKYGLFMNSTGKYLYRKMILHDLSLNYQDQKRFVEFKIKTGIDCIFLLSFMWLIPDYTLWLHLS